MSVSHTHNKRTNPAKGDRKRTLEQSDGAPTSSIQPTASTSAPQREWIGGMPRSEWDAHTRKLQRAEAQVRAELPAFDRFEPNDREAPTTLFQLIADAIGETDRNDLEGSALRALADDLDAIYHAITNPLGGLVHEQLGLERVPLMLWRLARRAEATAAIAERARKADRLTAEPTTEVA